MLALKQALSLSSSNRGGGAETDFVFSVDTTIEGSSGTGKFAVPISGTSGSYDIDWGDGNSDTGQTGTITHTYSSSAVYTIKISGSLTRFTFGNGGDKLKLNNISNWGVFVGDLSAAFYGCSNMTSNATDSPTIGVASSFVNMFRNCSLFNGDISSWDVSEVTNFQACFFNCSVFNQDLGSWDVSNATSVKQMFQGATVFNQDIGSWDVSSCTNFANFLLSATNLTFSSSNLDAIYNGWSTRTLSASESISFGSAKYSSAASAGRAVLTSAPNNWTITDGGLI
tara:strand:- start:617 stop:1465 length:849 start_codon:yes stop_codon:yes gene_type:complete